MIAGIRKRAAKRWVVAAGAALLAAALAARAPAQGPDEGFYSKADLRKLENTFSRLADSVRPSVVSITTYRELFGREGRRLVIPVSQGSGFVYRSNGLIVTNHHVTEDADSIRVRLFNRKELDADIVQFDPRSDLAVLKIEAEALRVAPLGDLARVRQGQWAFTAGNPFGLAERDGNMAFSYGVVTAIGRSLANRIESGGMDRYYGNLIQTDASINPGNSGGPLFNIEGEVVGICTAMEPSTGVERGVGFAIPIEGRTRRIIETLAAGNVVRYGYLGVQVVPIDKAAAQQRGVPEGRGALVLSVVNGDAESPASQVGLKADDIITEFDGAPIDDSDQLVRLVGATPVDSEVGVVFYRDRRRQDCKVKLVERTETAAARNRAERPRSELRFMTWRGLLVVEATDAFLQTRGFSRDDAGIFVVEAPADSPLARAGLRADTMIVRLNDQRVRTLDEFVAADTKGDGPLTLELSDGTTIRKGKG